MNYTKPEVAVLGAAVRVIEGVSFKSNVRSFDVLTLRMGRQLIPAYDLDA
jgi:hypothetical protein